MNTKAGENPIQRLPDWRTTMPLAHAAARCGAGTRAGGACQAPAMRNGRCRMHGGASTGPRTSEGLARVVKARTKHGLYAAEMLELRRWCAAEMWEARRLKELA